MKADVKVWLPLSRELDYLGVYSCPDLYPDDIAKAVTNSEWLAERDRAVAEKAWNEGHSWGWSDAQEAHDVRQEMARADWTLSTPNPYRKEADQ